MPNWCDIEYIVRHLSSHTLKHKYRRDKGRWLVRISRLLQSSCNLNLVASSVLICIDHLFEKPGWLKIPYAAISCTSITSNYPSKCHRVICQPKTLTPWKPQWQWSIRTSRPTRESLNKKASIWVVCFNSKVKKCCGRNAWIKIDI